MLQNEITKECNRINEKYQNYLRYDKRISRTTGASLVFALVGTILAFIQIPTFPESKILAGFFGIVFAIALIGVIVNGIKIRKFKLDGIEKIMLYAYRASISIEGYLRPGINESKLDDLDTAKEEIQNLKFGILYGWKYFAKYNSVISNFESNIGNFMDNIRRLEFAIESDKIEKADIVIILEELIKFFYTRKKDSFNEINDKFSAIKDVTIKISMEEKMKRKIIEYVHKKSTKRHIFINTLFIIAGIIATGILVYLKIPAEAQVAVVIGITITPLSIYWIQMIRIER